MEYKLHGMNIYYESIGSGLPMVMIHGWGTDHRALKGCMEPLFAGLDGSFRRIYFDLPGLGATKGNGWVSSADMMLEVVLELIEGIIPCEPFVLVGESYGGYLARGVISKKQRMVRGLLLKCPVACRETQLKNAPEFSVLEKDDSLKEMLTNEELSYFEAVTVVQTQKVWQRFKEDVLPGLRVEDEAYIMSNWGKQASFTFDADDLEQPFDAPSLILMGKQDSIVGYTDTWEFLKNYPRASFVVLDNAGHNLQIEQPELFNCLTREWLARVMASEKVIPCLR